MLTLGIDLPLGCKEVEGRNTQIIHRLHIPAIVAVSVYVALDAGLTLRKIRKHGMQIDILSRRGSIHRKMCHIPRTCGLELGNCLSQSVFSCYADRCILLLQQQLRLF